MRAITIQGYQYALDKARDTDNLDVQSLLALSHQDSENRPLCLCVRRGIPLQVKRIGGLFYLARMPAQGLQHALDCPFHGETEHGHGGGQTENINLDFSLRLNESKAIGSVNLSGLLNELWTRAGLCNWGKKYHHRSWKFVAECLYDSIKGLKINKITASQLVWVLPQTDNALNDKLSDNCLNFIRACTKNGHYGLVIGQIGESNYIKERKGMQLRFRIIDKLKLFVHYRHFGLSTHSLRHSPTQLYPVAIMLVKTDGMQRELLVDDIALLWMADSFTPCANKERVSELIEAMQTSEFIRVPLDRVKGLVSKVIGKTNTGVLLESSSPIRQQSWTPNDRPKSP